MKFRYIFNLLLIAGLSLGMVSCSEKLGTDNSGEDTEDGPSFGGGTSSDGTSGQGVSLVSFLNGIASQQGANVPRKKIYIVAHRGNTYAGMMAGCPDNSIPAIKKAIEVGADMIELDVRTTKDGKLVLMHDETINATTNGTGNVADLTLEQIKSYTMDRGGAAYKENGQTISVPTFEEAMLAVKGQKIYVNLDIKAVKSPTMLLSILDKTGTMNQVMIYGGSANKEYAETAQKRYYSDIAIHPQISAATGVDQWKSYPTAKLFQYNYDLWYNGSSIAKDVRAKGCLTYSNILNYDSQIKNGNYTALDKFINSETDFIQTDFCEKVHEYLQKKGLR